MSDEPAGTVSARSHFPWLVPLLVMVAGASVAWWASRPYLVGVFHDDGVYALLARSLATGQGFRYLQLPGAPAATHYPPLYPLALAAIWWLRPTFPDNVPAMLAFNAVCVGIAAVGLYRLLHRWFRWRRVAAAGLALFAMLGIPVLTLSGALLSEPLFLAALAPVLLLAHRAVQGDDRRSALVGGAAIGALMLVRAHAVALLAAVCVVLLVHREWRRVALVSVAAIAVQLPWLLWCARATPLVAAPLSGAYGSYGDFVRDGWRAEGLPLLLGTVRANFRELWLLLGDRLWGGLGTVLGTTAAALTLALLVMGGVRAARRAPVLPVFITVYFAIILAWSYSPYRYAWGLWPLLVVLAALGAQEVVARGRSPVARVALGALAALPFAAMLRTEVRGYAAHAWEEPARHASRTLAPVIEWIRHSTPPAAGMLVEAPEAVMLFSGRQGAPPVPFTAREYVMPVSAADHERGLRAMLAAVPVQYIVTFNPAVRAAARTLPGVTPIGRLADAEMFQVGR